MKRVCLVISGEVQGVTFRSSARKKALELGIAGWIRNLHKGTVEVVAEGAQERVREFTAWCRRGPPQARVDKVEMKEEKVEGVEGFVVRL